MWVNEVRNVNEAYVRGLSHLQRHGERAQSRGGEVLVSPSPVVTIYQRPLERVLFDAQRDANPFFHLFESLWMLAGRCDAAPLNRYVSNFGERFAEPGGYEIHGAYGHRWRHVFGFDQLSAVVARLRKDPGDRQCVIAMWDATTTYAGSEPDDLLGDWRDRPCNTHIYLRVRNALCRITGDAGSPDEEGMAPFLDLTVCCRSNDAVWGAHGANAVHFSILQEYLAGRIGVGVGRMYQFSNNYHVYTSLLEKIGSGSSEGLVGGPYYSGMEALPMGEDWATWDSDLAAFMAWHDIEDEVRRLMHIPVFTNQWFALVAVPMVVAHTYRKHPDSAGSWCRKIAAPDWQRAAAEWLNRRWRSK